MSEQLAQLEKKGGGSGEVTPITIGYPNVLKGQYFIHVALNTTTVQPNYTYNNTKCELIASQTYVAGYHVRISYCKALVDGSCNSMISSSNVPWQCYSTFEVD
jgi:hypothetical protein